MKVIMQGTSSTSGEHITRVFTASYSSTPTRDRILANLTWWAERCGGGGFAGRFVKAGQAKVFVVRGLDSVRVERREGGGTGRKDKVLFEEDEVVRRGEMGKKEKWERLMTGARFVVVVVDMMVKQ